MSVIDFKLDRPDAVPNKPLKDLGNESLVSATVDFKPTLPSLGVISFKVSAQANGKIDAFNDESDKDEDGVLGKNKEEDDGSGKVVLPPQIEINNQSAWLKYRFEATGKASAEAKVVKSLGVKVDASKKVVFADYQVHGQDENTVAAVAADIPNLRFAGNADDAFKLAGNEALYYNLRGEFSGKVSLSWSDVFTFGLNEIASQLKNSELVMIKVSPAASIDFHVGVVDDFQLVLTKGTGAKVRVALKKGKGTEVGVTAGFQVKAEFADPEKAEEFLNALFEATIGQPLNKIKQLINKPESELNKLISDLPPAAKNLIEAVKSRLKDNVVLETLGDFKKQIEKLEETIKKTIKTVATSKVELSFKYEYLRVTTDDTLFILQLNQETFKAFHKDLMVCDFIDLLEWARKDENKSSVERFLRQKTLTTTEAWGFTLGINKWKILFGKDSETRKTVIQEDIDRNQRVAYRFLRQYEEKLIGKSSWIVDFKAEMNKFAASPTACDFEYGLNFTRTFEGDFDRNDFRLVFDDALIWQGLTVSGLSKAIDEIETEGLLKKKTKAITQFTINDSTLRKLLPHVPETDNDELTASALALAMAYDENYPTRKDGLLNRERAYAPLWRAYFANPDLEFKTYAATAFNAIKNMTFLEDEASLADYEKGVGVPSNQLVYTWRPRTFSGTIYFHHKSNVSSTINDFRKRFIKGMLTWHDVIKQCQPHTRLEGVFGDLQPYFTQNLFVRAAGVYLIRLAARHNLLSEINRACTVTYADKTFNFGKAG